ncbi:MAG: hypothetical protein A3G33_08085 [Omnitrophica bacterium RIFCSPLOWO2_12_FULL_44_17]|uniref:Uncharacterized protein n=1 Tax=Candidatus Danuiimicrobium aquiferis TaxID=1801832 RepID=A0A1G1KXZ2_9BACT|nr:MAG: hypothetical protein A3B72_05785 [Omnitrophica bacterium RIFCSPHIGHO2_02_FULL_45_28]OGW92342.1 MAG: hypothetical protein A3E74_09410 [Omnitrophica bacterium RIFCSPHIGHO2_12_FULL_44_12]OGW97761.1 MAG: hypothetical protein A3G33_08085 [Omnitrophica bacterium RIFCSPLOWO2_12_FULL_44_17]OGX04987.1 MAG: hypothetical protein A3J12_02125 [Omnitrophica bacterium RIFCSPLOWO2_02_FULL_44_11]
MQGHDCSTANPEIRKLYGCDEPLPEDRCWQFGGYIFDRCAHFYLKNDALVRDSIEMFDFMEKGYLPYPGSYLNQPNKAIETYHFIVFLIGKKQVAEHQVSMAQRKPALKK